MASKFRAWWQKIQQHWIAIVVVVIGVVIVIALIVLAYKFDWTGFNSHTGPKLDQNQQYRPEKTLWDWLQLLIVPLVLAIGGFWLSQIQKTTEQRSTTDNQHEAALQAYIDKISELLLKEHLVDLTADGKFKPEYEQVRKIARVRTVTVLTQLDARRVGSIFTFLREAGLMSTTSNSSVVSLKDADLRAVNWSQATLREATLTGADLSGANLSGANLSGANLTNTTLSGANLSEANLRKATLTGANLSGANLKKATLGEYYWTLVRSPGATLREAKRSKAYSGADLREVNLSGADLRKANLSGADLSAGANLSGADLRKATLTNANLSGANLTGAKVTKEQLKEAKSLQDVIMPDGSEHP